MHPPCAGTRLVLILTRPLAIALAALLALGACAGSEEDPSDDARPLVVASFAPLAEAAREIAGNLARVEDLTPPGAEPHDVELTTAQLDRLHDANVVIYLGGGFQPAVEEAVKRAEGRVVDLMPAHAGADPHIWLDPLLMSEVARSIWAALAETDPDNARTYQRNVTTYGAALAGLDEEYARGLANCERKVIVTAHDSFGHLAKRYGLRQHALAGMSPEAEPEPRRLAELADLVRREGLTTVFYESSVSPAAGRTLAREAGVTAEVLDPIETLTREQRSRGDTYLTLMRRNLAALRKALGCR